MATAQGTMDKLDPHGYGLFVMPTGLGPIILAFLGIIPVIFGGFAAVLMVAYYILAIWEKPTIQAYIKNRRDRKTARKLAQLTKRQSDLTAEFKALGVLTRATMVTQPDIGGTVSTTTVETKTPN